MGLIENGWKSEQRKNMLDSNCCRIGNYILAILFFFCSLALSAEYKVAIVSDPDGFTNIRGGPGKDFNVVDTLYKDDLFYIEFVDNSEWTKIGIWSGNQIPGFVHKNRIQIIENLDIAKQKELISQILDRQKTLANNLQNAWETKDSLVFVTTFREIEFYNSFKYSPILEVLPKYFCSTNDVDILQLFFETMWVDAASANEMPAAAIGACFVCKPDIVIEQLMKIEGFEQKNLILNHIEFYLGEKSDNKEFNKLKALLDNERKNVNQ